MGEIVNPYIAGAPVTEQRMFFGREDIFQWVENSIAGQYADHILVVHGQRRVGKTSVLKQLGNRLPKRFIPVFFDLQGRTHTTLDHFLWWLARETVRVLKQERDIDVPPPEKQDFSSDPDFFENQFLTGLRSALGNNTLLLTFDEFDNLEESEVKEELARPLVDHLRRLMGQPNLNFIFSIGSSGRKLENMQAAYTDFFKTALYKKISFLSEEQTRHLITRPVEGIIEYERAAVERIHHITSGHPYFTQLTCHELFARCQRTEQRKIAKADVEAVLDDVVERGTVNLKFVWDEATDIEKWSLAALAQLEKTDNRAVADYLRKNRVRFSETDLTSGLLHLREKDVLTSQNHFVIHLLRIWLQKNRPIEQVREELTEANPIASRFIEIGLEFRDGGQYEKAIEYFRQALSVSADNLQAQVNIALTYATQGQLEQAIAEFERALSIDDEDVTSRAGLCDAHLALGDAALKRGRVKEAVLSYQRVLGINAEHLEARGRMAELSRQRAEKALTDGKDEEALSAFAEALKFTPEDQALIARSKKVRAEKNAKVLAELITRSGKEENAHNWDKAIEALNAALKITPGDESILNRIDTIQEKRQREQLGSILSKVEAAEKAGRWDTAIAGLQEYLQLKPEDPAIQKRIADLVETKHAAWIKAVMERVDRATTTQNWDEALSTLNEALRLEPENAKMKEKAAQVHEMRRAAELHARLQRADQAIKAGGWEEAIDILNDGLASDPENETLKTKLAEARKAKREARLQVALRFADSAAQAGKWEAAVASLKEVLANEPDNVEFQKKLADVRAQEHQSRWEAARTKAEDLREEERFEQALQVWQAYSMLYPEDHARTEKETKQVTQEKELLDLYAKAGTAITARDFDEAIRSLKEIIIRDENYKDASRLLTKAIESRRTGSTRKLSKPRKKPAPIQKVRAQDAPKAGGKRIRIIGGLVVILALAIAGVFFGPKLWENLSIGTQQAAGGTPTSPAEPVSFEPILAYIAERQPDFEDDFSSDKWGDLADGISTKNLIQDETLILNLEAGTNSEKLVLGGSNIQASQFALEFDFRYDGGTGGTTLNTGFPSLGNGTNGDISIYLEERSWSIGLSDSTIKYSGEIDQTLVGQWAHLQVLYSDSQVAAFLNGKLLGTAEGISHLGNEIWIATATGGRGKIRLDNIKFWNLDALNSSVVVASPTPALDPAIQIALDTIQKAVPTYKTSFDTWDVFWGAPEGNVKVENGKLIVTSENQQYAGTTLQEIPSDQFAVEFDLQILDSSTGSQCIFATANEYDYGDASHRALGAMFFPSGQAGLAHYVHPDLYLDLVSSENNFDFSKSSTVTLIFLGDRIAAFIDGQLAYTVIDPDGSAVYTRQGLAANFSAQCEYDNFKIWDLSGVDLLRSSTTPTPEASAFYKPIQAYITSTSPDFSDDFSNTNPAWYPIAEGIPIADMINYDLLNLELEAGTPTEKFVLSADAMKATDFALEVEFDFGGWTGDTVLGVGFPTTGKVDNTNFDFHIGLETQKWFIGLTDGSVEQQGELSESLRWRQSHLQIIFFNAQAGVFLNGKFLGQIGGIQRPESGIWIYAVTGDQGRVGIDNVKFWNLEKFTSSSTVTSTPPPNDTADRRVSNPANQHLYLLVHQTETWSDARDHCSEQGGYLVTIQDAAEDKYIYSLTKGYTWLGATDEESEGTWVWVSGEPWKYTNWQSGGPNNEDFLTYNAYEPYVWDDLIGNWTTKRYFVCEWEPATTALASETQVSPKDSMPMKYVPAGEFSMGSNKGSSNEKPVHAVHLDPFWMDQTEVTNRMYSLCVSAGVCQAPKKLNSYSRDSYYGNSDFDNYPVIYIDWDMANTYCKWAGRRLPTEAEWEKAARGTSMYTYPWGEGLGCDKVNALGCKGETSPVGEYELGKSPYGVLDMAGNVMEWVADWYSSTYYENSPRQNPSGPSSGTQHVLRGGSWKSIENNLRSSYRFGLTPDMTNFYLIGFRCAMGATQ